MTYNNKFKMRKLFMNPKLSNIFPQFDNSKSQLTDKDVKWKILKYIRALFRGKIDSENNIIIRGKHPVIMRRITKCIPVIEELFNNLPIIKSALSDNSRLYTTFASVAALSNIKAYSKKLAALKQILENFAYNPDFQSEKQGGAVYLRRQQKWKLKVGYKERL